MHRNVTFALLSTLLGVGACASDGKPDTTANPCEGPDCKVEPDAPPTPDGQQGVWDLDSVFGVANVDDDNDDGQTDFNGALSSSDDDVSSIALSAQTLADIGESDTLTLRLEGDTDAIKVYRDDELVLGEGSPNVEYRVSTPQQGVSLKVSFGNYLATGTLVFVHADKAGTVKNDANVSLQAAPLIMNHHLQTAEQAWVVRVSDNADMVNDFASVLGSMFTSVAGNTVQGDVWIQDEFEFATASGAEGQRLNIVIDSIRNRGLREYTDNLTEAASTIAQTWGNPSQRTSYDSFGNLEASPPVTVDGVKYPFGKIYYGRIGNEGINTQLTSFLASQKVQAPFEIPTNWLCVGHVDEISSVVPDASSPLGFKLLLADVPSALALLQTIPNGKSLPLYADGHGYDTAGDIKGDDALIALNQSLQTDYLDPIRETFKQQLGLTDDDIILIPSLFETVSGCGGGVAALIPGMVNLTVVQKDSATHVFTADPFFRDSDSQSADPFLNAFRNMMPAGITTHFVDDWNTYHLNLGEVHCGSNVLRTPTSNWWTSAAHLLGEV